MALFKYTGKYSSFKPCVICNEKTDIYSKTHQVEFNTKWEYVSQSNISFNRSNSQSEKNI